MSGRFVMICFQITVKEQAMKNLVLLIFAGLMFTILIGNTANAGGMVPYKKGSFTTIEGQVLSSKTDYNPNTREEGLHLTVQTNSGRIKVHVSPQWWADKQKYRFLKGELVTVSGSRFSKDGEENIYAAELKRRFASSSESIQTRIAIDAIAMKSPAKIASKYGISEQEVRNIKSRVEVAIQSTLFPKTLKLRNKDSGDGLWFGRYQEERSVDRNRDNQSKMQDEMRRRMQGGRGGGRGGWGN
jgi:hypothetical protein